MRNEIEIMAPAGSKEAMMAAINSGAGSIYFGIENLNMRSRSTYNFQVSDLKEISTICKDNDVKSYLTVNTIIYDNDMDLMRRIVDTAKEYELDAIIASDISVLNYAFSQKVEIHISTQLNVTNLDAVKFFANFADVVVLARELNLDQVKHITDSIASENIRGPKGELIRIEMFAHGALCMAVSGKCYMSLHEWNKSANRGACLQTCRRSYEVTDKEDGFQLEIDNEYIMSPKDLKTIHFLNKIIDAGVRVLKIEGRGRSPEYVKTTVECYREAVESLQNGTYSAERILEWDKRLDSVYNRGFWDGYYLGQKLGEWSHIYGSQASTKKVLVGKVNNYFSKLQVAEVQVQNDEFKIGDNYLIMGPTTGVIEGQVQEIRKELISIPVAVKGDIISIPMETQVRRSDKIYKVVQTNHIK